MENTQGGETQLFSENYHKKSDDYTLEDDVYPFQDLSKMSVLHECKNAFAGPNVDSGKCSHLITKLLYCVLANGEKLTADEADDILIYATMLFSNNKDQKLRRMLYLLLKELSGDAQEAIMAYNSLSNDMTNRARRAYAIRALRTICDVSTFGQLDRHLEQAIVDQQPTVSSAALLSALHLSDMNQDVVKRWQEKIQAAMVSRKDSMVQYHALAVMYKLRHKDSLAVSKLVTTNTNNFISPLSHSLLIRYSTRILNSGKAGDRRKIILKYLTSCLSFTSDIIAMEAAKALASIDGLTEKELGPAVSTLQSFLLNSSMRPVHRFAAIRILNNMAEKHPALVEVCNVDIKELMEDKNPNIATIATTTLLKCGNEHNVESLLQQISSFMKETSDEFKVMVIRSLPSLSEKYPSCHPAILSFLSDSVNPTMNPPSGTGFKEEVIDMMIQLIRNNERIVEKGVEYLCDFIEDCEFTSLSVKILHVLGEIGPNSPNPSFCIRLIYNRLILENASVRAAAIVSLSKFAAALPKLKPSILVILKRSLQDHDDEVRDRAVMALNSLQEDELQKAVFDNPFYFNPKDMEVSLAKYLAEKQYMSSEFDVDLIEETVEDQPTEEEEESKDSQPKEMVKMVQPIQELFSKVKILREAGKPFKSSHVLHLTESDSDYVVDCRKHILKSYIVFQFIIKNQVEDHTIQNVIVNVDFDIDGLDVDEITVRPAKSIAPGQVKSVLVVLQREEDSFPCGEMEASMAFNVVSIDADPEDEPDEDEYEFESIPLTIGDYLKDKSCEFKPEWDNYDEENETREVLEYSNTDRLQESILRFEREIGLTSLVDTAVIEGQNKHTVYFSGALDNGTPALIYTAFKEQKKRVLMQLAVRSEDEELRQKIFDIVQ